MWEGTEHMFGAASRSAAVCGAENLGRATISWMCPEKLGKRERTASADTEDLSAAPSLLAKLGLITEFSEVL